jgi:hypothetical protein
MPSAWYLGEQGVEYLYSKGYHIYINTFHMEEPKLVDFWLRIEKLRKEANELMKQEREKEAKLRQSQKEEFDRKSKEMIGDMLPYNQTLYRNEIELIPETMINLEEKSGSGMYSTTRRHHCVRVKIPKLNCEGIEQFWDIYDMETWNYYVPKAIAEKVDAENFQRMVNHPDEYVVGYIFFLRKIEGFSDNGLKNLKLDNSEIQETILINFKQNALKPIEITDQIKKELDSRPDYIGYKQLKDVGWALERIYKQLMIYDQVMAIRTDYNQRLEVLAKESLARLDAKKQTEKLESEKKWKEYNDRKLSFIAELERMTKTQLVEKYHLKMQFRPSWGKAKVIEEIVRHEMKFS